MFYKNTVLPGLLFLMSLPPPIKNNLRQPAVTDSFLWIHRIIQLGRHLWRSSCPTTCSKQANFKVKATSNLITQSSLGRYSTTIPGYSLQCLTAYFYLTSSQKLSTAASYPFTGHLSEEYSSIFSLTSFRQQIQGQHQELWLLIPNLACMLLFHILLESMLYIFMLIHIHINFAKASHRKKRGSESNSTHKKKEACHAEISDYQEERS